jgi:hypothetical protein
MPIFCSGAAENDRLGMVEYSERNPAPLPQEHHMKRLAFLMGFFAARISNDRLHLGRVLRMNPRPIDPNFLREIGAL